MTKQCLKCKKEYNINNFHKNNSRKDKLHYYCKNCFKDYHKENYNYLKRKEQFLKMKKICPKCKINQCSPTAKNCRKCIRLLQKKGIIKVGKSFGKKEKHWNWKGGKTNLRNQIENLIQYRQWRSDIFTRDNFTCQKCEIKGGYLHAHHKKTLSKIIEEYQIKTLEQALNCEELWNINNGITLCKECHKIIHNIKCVKCFFKVH